MARILDILYVHCQPANPIMPRTEILEVCQEHYIGHNAVEAALKCQFSTDWGSYTVFETAQPDDVAQRRFSSPAFDPDTTDTARVQRRGKKSRRGRPLR